MRSERLALLLPLLAAGCAQDFDFRFGTPSPGAWQEVTGAEFPRELPRATVLLDGRVFLSGGADGTSVEALEIFDPGNATWTSAGTITYGRFAHTADLLGDGRVLLAGGILSTGVSVPSYLIVDPVTGGMQEAPMMYTARSGHTSAKLATGEVLVCGGFVPTLTLNECERYVPDDTGASPGDWIPAAAMVLPRSVHTATTLEDGSVLVVGGNDGAAMASSERYEPQTDAWMSQGDLLRARFYHTATRLPDGRVLVTGGQDSNTIAEGCLDSAEIYNPSSGNWKNVAPMSLPRCFATATLLPSGYVLVSGGRSGDEYHFSAELFDPASESWHTASNLAQRQASHAAVLVGDEVILIGGWRNGAQSLTQRWNPSGGVP